MDTARSHRDQPSVSFIVLHQEGVPIGRDSYNYRRILTEDNEIKYLASKRLRPFHIVTVDDELGFNTVPNGDWNIGYLHYDGNTKSLILDSTAKKSLAAVEETWSTHLVDWLELREPSSDLNDAIAGFKLYAWFFDNPSGGGQVMVHFRWHPEHIMHIPQFTRIYARIEGYGIGPTFLGHITENRDRIVGYMVERVHGRLPTISDLGVCRDALTKFHSLGLALGQPRRTCFVIDPSGRALLHDFEEAYETDDGEVFRAELASLEKTLQEKIDPFVPLDEKLSEKLMAIRERDGDIHPVLAEQAQVDGAITMTEREHKALLAEFARNDYRYIKA